MKSEKRTRLVRTPIHKIAIGEAIKEPDGHYSLRIKRPDKAEYEVIALDQLFSIVMNEAERE